MDDIGYEITRFPEINHQVLENFFCNVCTLVVRAPKECTNCNALFCSICIEQWCMVCK